MRNRKRIMLSVMLALAILLVPSLAVSSAKAQTSYEARIGATSYETFSQAVAAAVDGDTVEVLKNTQLNGTTVEIKKSITVNGNGHSLNAQIARPIRVYGDASKNAPVNVTFNDLKIYSDVNVTNDQRCLETRGGGYINLTLNNVTLEAKGNCGGNPQILTISSDSLKDGGGYYNLTVNINGGKIISGKKADKYGYGIIIFTPVELTLNGTELEAYSAIYAKRADPGYTYGSKGSSITLKDCRVESVNNYPASEDNRFGAFAIEEDDITLNIVDTAINISSSTGAMQDVVEFGPTGSDTDPHIPARGSVTFSGNTVVTGVTAGKIIADADTFITPCDSTNSIAVSGGSYCDEIPEKYWAPDYVIEAMPNGSYGSVPLGVSKGNAVNSIYAEKNGMYINNRYTSEKSAELEALALSAEKAISSASDITAVKAAVSAFRTDAAAVAVIPLADYKSDRLAEIADKKAALLSKNRYTDENVSKLNELAVNAETVITAATTYTEVDVAKAEFTAKAVKIEAIAVTKLKTDAIASLEENKKALLESGRYDSSDEKAIEEYFKNAKGKILSASAPDDVELACDEFTSSISLLSTDKPNGSAWIVVVSVVGGVIVIAAVVLLVLLAHKKKKPALVGVNDSEKQAEPKADTAMDEHETAASAEEPESPAEAESNVGAEEPGTPAEQLVPESTFEKEQVEPVDEVAAALVGEENVETANTTDAVASELKRETTPHEERENGKGELFARLSQIKPRSFAEKLDGAEASVRGFYAALKDELLSYKKVKSRLSQKGDSFRVCRRLIAKIVFAGKSLKCYLALEPKEYEYKKFHHRDESVKKSYAAVPMAMRVRSKLAVKKTIALIGDIADKNELVKK